MIKVQNGIASREPVPAALAALLPETLMHLQTALDPVPPEFAGMEWWPESSEYPAYDSATHALGDEVLTVDAEARVVRVTWPVVALPPEVLAQRLADAKAVKNTEINREWLLANRAGFEWRGGLISTDTVSKPNIDGVGVHVGLFGEFPADFPMAWKTEANDWIPMQTVADFKEMYAAMVAQGNGNFAKAQTLKGRLEAATTLAEVNAILW